MIYQHKLKGVEFVRTPNCGGSKLPCVIPRVIVLHDTAGRLDYRTSVDWLCNPASKASAHLVVGRDGELVQLLEFNKRAWHAGKSLWRSQEDVNNFSIGIEIVNPGHLDSTGKPWFDQRFSLDLLEEASSPYHPTGLWMPYTHAQLKTLVDVVADLLSYYPTIEDIVPHWAVSPGRKHDVNPLFPLTTFVRMFNLSWCPGLLVVGDVTSCSWPGYTSMVRQVLSNGQRVHFLKAGWFRDNIWYKVGYPGGEGWLPSGQVRREL